MKRLIEEAGLNDQFEIASAATSTEEIGNPVYPPARRKLAEHGIGCEGKTARQMTRHAPRESPGQGQPSPSCGGQSLHTPGYPG